MRQERGCGRPEAGSPSWQWAARRRGPSTASTCSLQLLGFCACLPADAANLEVVLRQVSAGPLRGGRLLRHMAVALKQSEAHRQNGCNASQPVAQLGLECIKRLGRHRIDGVVDRS